MASRENGTCHLDVLRIDLIGEIENYSEKLDLRDAARFGEHPVQHFLKLRPVVSAIGKETSRPSRSKPKGLGLRSERLSLSRAVHDLHWPMVARWLRSKSRYCPLNATL
jgi:hypothetical protein